MKLPAALATWLAIQSATLAFSAARLPLWARAGSEPQHLALAQILVVQFIASALLFPSLSEKSNGIAVAMTALPFIQLAAFLSSTPPIANLTASIHVMLWLIGLTAWANTLHLSSAKILARLAFVLLSLGVPLLTYFIREFGDLSVSNGVWINPTACAIEQSASSAFVPASMTCSGVIFLTGLIAILFTRTKNISATGYPHHYPPSAH